MYIFSFENNLLPLSTRRGIISLIPKKDRDPLRLKNWRPLTLLNCDYKILTKAIVYRIRPYLDHLIHPSQTGFMQDRNISHNIRKIIDLINIVENEDIIAVLISLDFEKAFHRVEHNAKQKP